MHFRDKLLVVLVITISKGHIGLCFKHLLVLLSVNSGLVGLGVYRLVGRAK